MTTRYTGDRAESVSAADTVIKILKREYPDGLTLSQVAERTGISKAYLKRIVFPELRQEGRIESLGAGSTQSVRAVKPRES